MRHRSAQTLGLLLVALLLVAAACGGGGKKSVATTAPAATVPAATTAAIATVPTTTSSLAGLASAKNCKELGDLGTKFSEAVSGTGTSTDVKKMAQLLQDFAAKTPTSIRPDFTFLAGAYSKIADAIVNFKPGTTPDPAALAKLQKVSAEIDTNRLTQASQNIAAWLQENCRS